MGHGMAVPTGSHHPRVPRPMRGRNSPCAQTTFAPRAVRFIPGGRAPEPIRPYPSATETLSPFEEIHRWLPFIDWGGVEGP